MNRRHLLGDAVCEHVSIHSVAAEASDRSFHSILIMLLRNLIFSVSRSILRPSPYLPLTQLSNYHCVSRLLSPSLNVVNYGSSHSMLNQHGRANMSSDAPSASSSLDNELKSFLEEEIKAEKTNAIQGNFSA